MDTLITIAVTALGTTFAIILLFIFMYDRIEYIISRIFLGISKIFKGCRILRKKGIQLSIQSRINISAKRLKKKVQHELETEKIKIDWVEKGKTRKAFIEGGSVIIRLRKDDSDEQNYIHGTHLFISTCLLYKLKRHLDKNQKETMDLYVTADMFKESSNSIQDFYLEKYILPSIAKSKEKKAYYSKYQNIDKHGYFYTLLLNELNYLGKKVFATVGQFELTREFDQLIDFLEKAANRRIGDDNGDLKFSGQHTKLEIVIIGKPSKLDDESRYVDYINHRVIGKSLNSIYIVGDYRSKNIIDNICSRISTDFERVNCGDGVITVNLTYGGTKEMHQYYVILRRNSHEVAI